MRKEECQHCGELFDLSADRIGLDWLGFYAVCPHCEQSFDIDVDIMKDEGCQEVRDWALSCVNDSKSQGLFSPTVREFYGCDILLNKVSSTEYGLYYHRLGEAPFSVVVID